MASETATSAATSPVAAAVGSASGHNEELPAEVLARPSIADGGRASACDLLTALAHTAELIDDQPATTLAADDVWDELHRLAEGVDAARRAGQAVRDAGHHVERACPEDRPVDGLS